MRAESASDVEIDVCISGEDAAGELRSMLSWFSGEEELRGQARLAVAPPRSGQMGAGIESLVIALAPGGLVTAFATVLIAWIRSRSGSISVELSRPDGAKLRFDAKNVKALPRERVDELAQQIAGLVAAAGPGEGDLPSGAPEG